jgi:DNA-binding GntR family transcriptional regulator
VLRARIDSGELAPGDCVPSPTTQSQDYGVALTTAGKVLAALKHEELIETSPMGTFVRRGR